MDKRYQVFVSSTYWDLKDERASVLQTLLEMDCFPAGMELFPAVDEEQFEFIKRVIDDCDYYLLVIGGRYGTLTEGGVSYTEKEFDYAVEKGLKVVALVHGSPEDISLGKSEQDPQLKQRLLAFREKVATGRLVKYWKNASDLPGLVALNVGKTIKMYPAVGWTRAGTVASEAILVEINELRKENLALNEKLRGLSNSEVPTIDDIADLDASVSLTGTHQVYREGFPKDVSFEREVSWRKLFKLISPDIVSKPEEALMRSVIGRVLYELKSNGGFDVRVSPQDLNTVAIQLELYGFIKREQVATRKSLVWSLTSKGEQLMYSLRAVREKL